MDFDNPKVIAKSIPDCNCLLLGESTHGTQEFYKIRAEITKRLSSEKLIKRRAVEAVNVITCITVLAVKSHTMA